MSKIAKSNEEVKSRSFSDHFSDHNKKQKVQIYVEPLDAQLIPYQEYFINSTCNYKQKTKSANRDKQFLELVKHAFGKYQVCNPLKQVWTNDWHTLPTTLFRGGDNNGKKSYSKTTERIDFRLWYICVARGGSLYKEFAKEYLTKKEVHCLLTCKQDLTINQAVIFAIAKAACANENIAMKLAKSKIVNHKLIPFWKTVIQFFSEHPPESTNEIDDLLDYIDNHHRENPENKFGIKMAGQTLDGLRKKTQDWHYALRRAKAMGDDNWSGVFLPDESFKTKDQTGEVTWSIEQIKTAKGLAAEGTKMRHCVFSYKNGCVQGHHSIWSLAKSDLYGTMTPKLTIQLMNNGNIEQVRGLANRLARPDEQNIINMWARKQNLTYDRRY